MLYYKDLATDTVYGYDEAELSQLPYIQRAIDNGWQNITGSYPPPPVQPTYSELRAAAYPPIVDQLDTIFHGGLDSWKAEIQSVKSRFPK